MTCCADKSEERPCYRESVEFPLTGGEESGNPAVRSMVAKYKFMNEIFLPLTLSAPPLGT